MMETDAQDALFPEVLPPRDDDDRRAPNGGNGRPRGARNHKHKILERIARQEAVPLLRSVIKSAMDGDMIAAKIIFDRIWPRPKSSPLQLQLPETKTPAELRAAMHDLLGRVASGAVSTEDGQAVVAIMKDILQAHTMQAVMSGGVVQAEATSARDEFAKRLARVIEARAVARIEGPEEAAS
jgi:hypothetical protein